MNSYIKQQWINALRSGEYSQGTGHLQTSEGGTTGLSTLNDAGIEFSEIAQIIEEQY